MIDTTGTTVALVHGASDATLPLPDICTVALDRRRAAQSAAPGCRRPGLAGI